MAEDCTTKSVHKGNYSFKYLRENYWLLKIGFGEGIYACNRLIVTHFFI